MAKAMMVFEDNEDGSVSIKAVFEPELIKGKPLTEAQMMVLGACSEAGKMISDLYDDSEKH